MIIKAIVIMTMMIICYCRMANVRVSRLRQVEEREGEREKEWVSE